MAKILDGKSLSIQLQNDLTQEISLLTSQGYRHPKLAVILVGDDIASKVYVSKKRETCEKVGILSEFIYFSADIEQETLVHKILELNKNNEIDGILLQLPLPEHLDEKVLLELIIPNKDVDGFHVNNIGCLALRQPRLRSCTPFGIIQLLEAYQIDLSNKFVVIVGASNIVGRPLALEFLNHKASVSVLHRFTPKETLQKLLGEADILVSATGKKNIISPEYLKEGVIVLDVGIHRDENGKVSGDLDFELMKNKASYITPVPGGVGPMTVVSLMKNTFQAYQNHISQKEDFYD